MSSTCHVNEEATEVKIGRILKTKGLKIATAESCTGGLVAGTLVNVDGISQVFEQGFVTYSDAAKTAMLGVSPETLAQFTAVSPQTAKEMAEGAAARAKADVAVSTTGIAGPTGGSAEKPVGLVYIGCTILGETTVKACFFTGDRESIRRSAVKEALELLYCKLLSL